MIKKICWAIIGTYVVTTLVLFVAAGF